MDDRAVLLTNGLTSDINARANIKMHDKINGIEMKNNAIDGNEAGSKDVIDGNEAGFNDAIDRSEDGSNDSFQQLYVMGTSSTPLVPPILYNSTVLAQYMTCNMTPNFYQSNVLDAMPHNSTNDSKTHDDYDKVIYYSRTHDSNVASNMEAYDKTNVFQPLRLDFSAEVRPLDPNARQESPRQNGILSSQMKENIIEHNMHHTPVHGMVEERPYKCEVCSQTFGKLALNIYQRKNTGEKAFVCKFCLKVLSSTFSLQKGKSLHTRDRHYKCEKCCKICAVEDLKTHVVEHLSELQYACEKCSQTYTCSTDLEKHLLTHKRKFVCKRFSNGSSLQSRKKNQSIKVQYKCMICSKICTSSAYLKEHLLVHKSPFACKLCWKVFLLKSHLQYHLIIAHEKKCEICEKTFQRTALLKAHLRTHIAEKAYECTVCNMKFTYSSALSIHVRIHKTL